MLESRTGTTSAADAHWAAGATVAITPVGGPTALIEIGGLRLLTDPTFDGPGEYPVGSRTLRKTAASALTPDDVEPIDVVLLSHDQHPDNLDGAGRRLLNRAPLVLTTPSAHARLRAATIPLKTWETFELRTPTGRSLHVTAMPALHGPVGTEHLTGEVTGFLLHGHGQPTVYVSGDNASIDVVRQVARYAGRVDVAVLFAGAARTPLIPQHYLTLTSDQAATAAIELGAPHTVVVHTDGWAHFTETYIDVRTAFAAHHLAGVLTASVPGARVVLGKRAVA